MGASLVIIGDTCGDLLQTFDSETAWNQKNKSKHPSIRSGTDVDKDYASSFHVKVCTGAI